MAMTTRLKTPYIPQCDKQVISDHPKSKQKYQLYYRPIQQDDKQIIKHLHEQWFPVEYTTEFYDAAIRNMTISNHPLYSCVAIISKDYEYQNDEESRARLDVKGGYDFSPWQRLADSVGSCRLNGYDLFTPATVIIANDSEVGLTQSSNGNEMHCSGSINESIVACVIGSFCSTQTSSQNYAAEILIRNPKRYTKMFYIMTLGTTKEFRNIGLGTKLIEDCVKLVQNTPTCGALYLHVITYNQVAIRFYEKMGFYRMDEIKDYYNIDGKTYGCYLYARFFHGNRPSLMKMLSRFWTRIISPFLALGVANN